MEETEEKIWTIMRVAPGVVSTQNSLMDVLSDNEDVSSRKMGEMLDYFLKEKDWSKKSDKTSTGKDKQMLASRIGKERSGSYTITSMLHNDPTGDYVYNHSCGSNNCKIMKAQEYDAIKDHMVLAKSPKGKDYWFVDIRIAATREGGD